MSISPKFRRSLLTTLALAALLLAGCDTWKERIVWSPDGERAAVITGDGLYLTDGDGKLSPLPAPGVYRAAWMDSQRLVLARVRKIHDYADLAKALGPERTRALTVKAEMVWQQWLVATKGEFDSPQLLQEDIGAVVVYLREHHGAALRAKVAEKESAENDLKELESMAAGWHSLVVARIAGEGLEIGATLSEGLAEIQEIRPAPGGSAVAFVTHLELNPGYDDGLSTFVVPADASSPAVSAASHTSGHPDWTPDGRTLVYFQGANGDSMHSNLQLGALVERQVLDAGGHIALGEKTRDLAGLIFGDDNRVRCLRDGRVLFDAGEFHLPIAGSDSNMHEQLFAIDRTQEKAALVPLISPEQLKTMQSTLANFELSPDQAQVLFINSLHVLTLADNRVESVQVERATNKDKTTPLPAWRRPGEFVYLKKGTPRPELVLHHGTTETVLSRNWSDEFMKRLAD